jgi:hypothetical protein
MRLDVMLDTRQELRALVASRAFLPILPPFTVLGWVSLQMSDDSLISHDVCYVAAAPSVNSLGSNYLLLLVERNLSNDSVGL